MFGIAVVMRREIQWAGAGFLSVRYCDDVGEPTMSDRLRKCLDISRLTATLQDAPAALRRGQTRDQRKPHTRALATMHRHKFLTRS